MVVIVSAGTFLFLQMATEKSICHNFQLSKFGYGASPSFPSFSSSPSVFSEAIPTVSLCGANGTGHLAIARISTRGSKYVSRLLRSRKWFLQSSVESIMSHLQILSSDHRLLGPSSINALGTLDVHCCKETRTPPFCASRPHNGSVELLHSSCTRSRRLAALWRCEVCRKGRGIHSFAAKAQEEYTNREEYIDRGEVGGDGPPFHGSFMGGSNGSSSYDGSTRDDLSEIGVIVVDHGSRRRESNEMLDAFVKVFEAHTGRRIVEAAHMEIAEPSIATAFDRCVQRGAKLVVVSPYFLSPGRHWYQDIPSLTASAAKKHPGIKYLVSAPIGIHHLVAQVVNDRIDYCLRHVAGNVPECDTCHGTGYCKMKGSSSNQQLEEVEPVSVQMYPESS